MQYKLVNTKQLRKQSHHMHYLQIKNQFLPLKGYLTSYHCNIGKMKTEIVRTIEHE